MFGTQREDGVDVFVIEPVEHVASVLSETDQATGPQQFQLLADGGLLHAKLFTDGIDTPLPSFQEKQDFQPGWISEHLEKFGNVHNLFFQRQHMITHGNVPLVSDKYTNTVPK